MAKSSNSVPTSSKAPQIDNDTFMETAQPLTVKIGEALTVASPKSFSSGSVGYYCGEKVTIVVDGKPLKCQVSMSVIVVGSKPAE